MRYTVKQVADLTGVPPATLRAWERRYGVVAPARTDSRYRLYDEDDVVRLGRMAELVAAGHRASLAAEQVASGPAGAASGGQPAPSGPGPLATAVTWEHGGPSAAELVQAARTFDADLLDRVLDEAFARGSFESVVEGWLMPALEELGDAWERGRIDVAGEHFVSAAVVRRLSQAFEAAGVRTGAPVAVVGLPAGAHHELGAVAFATCLRRQGVDVRYLGADLPLESWSAAVDATAAAGVVIGVPTTADAEAAARALAGLDHGAGGAAVFVGGGGSAQVPVPAGVTPLPDSLVAAAATVAAELHR